MWSKNFFFYYFNKIKIIFRVLDYTVWPSKNSLNNHKHKHYQTSTQSSSNMLLNQNKNLNLNRAGNKVQEFKDPIQMFYESLHLPHRANLFLRVCISGGNSQYSSMKKICVVERRGLEIAKLNCSQLLLSNVKQSISNFSSVNNVNKNINKNEFNSNSLQFSTPPRPLPSYFNETNNNLGDLIIKKKNY